MRTKRIRIWFAALLFSLASPIVAAQSFTVDTSGTSMSGLWNNPNEAGWGTAVIHQYGVMFVTMYTYDGGGSPVWYVASNCAVIGSRCSGTLFRVTGGSSPTAPWNGSNRTVAPVGTLTLTFSQLNTATMTFTIDGASGFKTISRSIFAAPSTPTSPVAETCAASNFTRAKFDAIARGMTHDQVNQIIGCKNDPRFTQASSVMVMYGWNNYSTGGVQSIFVIFEPSGTFVHPDYPAFKIASGF